MKVWEAIKALSEMPAGSEIFVVPPKGEKNFVPVTIYACDPKAPDTSVMIETRPE